jgi:hypothetical protein
MTQPQTLEQWLANEEQKQKTRNSEPDKEELITQINHLNLELVQEKRNSQIWEENWKKAEKELENEKEWATVLTNYRNWKRKDGLTNALIISVSIIIGCIIHYFKQKEEEEKKQITNF